MNSEGEVKIRVSPELAAITYLVSESFTSYDDFIQKSKGCWEICSFVETKLETLNKSNFVQFNKKNFSRIYPKGSRTMSSNYNPEPFWCCGSQLVALNLQTMGSVSYSNEGKFKDNGSCGYILKPYYLRHNYKGIIDDSFVPPFPILLTIEIISGRHLPFFKTEVCFLLFLFFFRY